MNKVLQNRHFRHLWLSQITSQLAINTLAFMLGMRVYQQTLSNTLVSVMILAVGFPAIVFGPIAGVYVDRWDKRNVLTWCNLLRAVLVAGFFFTRQRLNVLFLLAAVISSVTQFFVPAETSAIPRLVHKDQLLSANSLFSFTFFTTVALGSLTAGPLIRLLGWSGAFFLLGLIFALAAFFSHKLPKLVNLENQEINGNGLPLENKVIGQLIEVLNFLKENSQITKALMLLTGIQALITTLAILAPGFADKILLISVEESSLVVMAPALIGMISGAVFLAGRRDFTNRTKVVNFGFLLSAASLFCSSFISAVPLFFYGYGRIITVVLLLFVAGIGLSFSLIPLSTFIQEETEKSIQGRVFGIFTAMVGGVSIMPSIVGGSLADTLGVQTAVFFIALLMLVFGIYRTHRLYYNGKKRQF